jgi:hypothetical protein
MAHVREPGDQPVSRRLLGRPRPEQSVRGRRGVPPPSCRLLRRRGTLRRRPRRKALLPPGSRIASLSAGRACAGLRCPSTGLAGALRPPPTGPATRAIGPAQNILWRSSIRHRPGVRASAARLPGWIRVCSVAPAVTYRGRSPEAVDRSGGSRRRLSGSVALARRPERSAAFVGSGEAAPQTVLALRRGFLAGPHCGRRGDGRRIVRLSRGFHSWLPRAGGLARHSLPPLSPSKALTSPACPDKPACRAAWSVATAAQRQTASRCHTPSATRGRT